ncbi:DUF11 domain-containing protein [Microbacterium sp. 4R-513]|uniref:DUF7507 domain-containing protein n=1 Tax=Microbacterium sp. 4R-513 TaxID=2567934 RepID=UPI0013E111D6|nr:DUF11 domain-containing protein [Microbacterium sp. 4R-513]QIG39214.1 DUF11 domain-containing protein [Microbacterium sp. 4R-513]
MSRRTSRPPVRRAVAAVLSAALLVGGLSAIAAPAAADPPTGGSVIVDETFRGATVADPGWTVQGDACLTGAAAGATPPAGAAQIPSCVAHRSGPVPPMGGAPDGFLQLTDTAGNRAGSILYNRPVPASSGISVTFEQYQYGGNGADGIGFFLVDGSTSLTSTGGLGGSLGYAQRNSEPGVNGGYLGVGLDAYGNFYGDGENRGANCPVGQKSPTTASGALAPNVVTLRGPGNNLTGYCWLDSTVPKPITNPTKPGTTLNGGTGTLRAATLAASKRTVNVQVTPVTPATPVARVIVQIRYTDAGPWVTELDIPAPSNTPSTYKFGFSASTGGSNDVHLLRQMRIETILPLASLALEKQVDRTGTALPPVITVGTAIPYQYTVTNTGAPVTGLFVTDNQIATANIVCDATSLTTAPAAGSSTVCRGSHIVTAADVAAGQVVNIATATAVPQGGGIVTSPEATVTVPLVATMTISKSVTTPPPYSIGQQVAYSYTLTNTGGSILRGFVVSDDRMASNAITCLSGELAPGASTTCSGSHAIQAGQINSAGFLVNTASVTGQTPIGQRVTAGPAQAQIPVATDVGVAKTVDDSAPLVGSDVTFTITATGNGPATATGVVITDLVPDGDPVGSIVYQSSTVTQGAYNPLTGAWTVGTLAPTQTATLTITATVNTGTPFTNTAVRSRTDQPDRDPTNDVASVTINPVQPSMDIAVTKDVDLPEIPLGAQATFTLTATNSGPQDATDVEVRDALPPGLTFVPDAPGDPDDGTYDPVTGIWDIGALAAGDTATRTITVIGSALGSYVNLAALTGNPSPPDSNPGNNADSATLRVVPASSDLAVVKAVFPQRIEVGQEVTYQLAASNLGPDAAQQVVVTDLIPAGVVVLSATATVGTITPDARTWNIGALAVGQQNVTATVTARIDNAGTLVNTATISSPVVDDPDPTNNSSSATVTSAEPELDIAVGKSVDVPSGASPDAVPLGDQVEFTLTAENIPGPSNATATDVVLTDALPDGLEFVSSAGDGAYDPATGLWTLDSIAPGATATRTVVATVTEAISFVNTVSLTSLTQIDSDPTNNSASVQVVGAVVADLSITKTADPAIARPGDHVTYTVVVANDGPNDATGVIAFDPFMPAAVIIDSSVTAGTFDEGTREWTIGDLAAGADATLTVVIEVQRPGWTRNVAVVLGLDQTDPNLDNNVDDAELFVPAADIAVEKTVDAPIVFVGDDVTFTVLLWNYGPDASGAVVVNDLLPAGLTFVSAAPSIGTYDPATGAWTVDNLEAANLPLAGAGRGTPPPQATLTIVATVDAVGDFENVATAPREAPDVFDPDLDNNDASAVVTAVPIEAELHITKTVDPASVLAGGAVTFTMTVSNAGPADAEDVVVEDPFPAGVTPRSTDTPGCEIVAGVFRCDIGTLPVDATASLSVTATVDEVGQFQNTATVSTSTTLAPGSSSTASATVIGVANSGGGSGGGGTLPVTGGTGPGSATPLAAVVLTMTGVLLLLWSRRRRREESTA